MKAIMKRAWEILRTLTGDHIAKLAMALRMAWAEKKNGGKKMEAKESVEFVQLEGSPKQIAWGEDIRKSFFEVAYANSKAEKVIKSIVNTKTSAKWWIEEVQMKGMIDKIDVLMKCADFVGTKPEFKNFLAAKMR